MCEQEKLQRALENTMAAGYQLDREAFAWLRSMASTEDPNALMQDALKRIEELENKPMFIGKSFLETIMKRPAPIEAQVALEIQVEATQEATQELIPLEEKSTLESPEPQKTDQTMNEGGSVWCPFAKNVESKLTVLEDPTSKLTSNGTLDDYLGYFQDRFKRIEKLLRQRIDVKAATSISEALKSQAKTKLKIICMITEKRESKQQTIISVEDMEANATVLVPHNASQELCKKAQSLIQDQIVAMAVIKTRSDLLLAEDIIFPEVGLKPQHRAAEPVYAVLTSDIHAGSNKFNKDAFKRFIHWLNGKYGNDKMREIASHVKYVLTAGDIVDGVGVYPDQEKELSIRDIYNQYKYASKMIERIPDYIEIIISPGNHDAPRKALPMPAISKDFLQILQETKRIHSVGDPSLISIHNVEILMYHGRSLDDVIGVVPGMSHSQPEKAMKLLLQGRHLAPLYGGKTLLSPENRDFLVIDKIPDILHSGHVHVLGYCNYRGVLIVNSGGWQEQTEYMQKLGLIPTPGKVPVVNLQTLETTVLSFL
jgi:DNA polymerase II small subunit